MNTMRSLKIAAVAFVLLALNGCASFTSDKFACPAPDGFACMNPVEVYEATNDINSVDEEAKKLSGKGKRNRREKQAQTIIVQAPSPVDAPAAQPVVVGPDRCCAPVLAGIQMGQNDSLSLARPESPIAASLADAVVMNRTASNANRYEIPEGNAYRSEARIMRIYVAPWEDEEGDLHMGGHIYSEIEPRKWRIGQRASDESMNTFSLLKGQVAEDPDEVASGQPKQGTTTNGFSNPQL